MPNRLQVVGGMASEVGVHSFYMVVSRQATERWWYT